MPRPDRFFTCDVNTVYILLCNVSLLGADCSVGLCYDSNSYACLYRPTRITPRDDNTLSVYSRTEKVVGHELYCDSLFQVFGVKPFVDKNDTCGSGNHISSASDHFKRNKCHFCVHFSKIMLCTGLENINFKCNRIDIKLFAVSQENLIILKNIKSSFVVSAEIGLDDVCFLNENDSGLTCDMFRNYSYLLLDNKYLCEDSGYSHNKDLVCNAIYDCNESSEESDESVNESDLLPDGHCENSGNGTSNEDISSLGTGAFEDNVEVDEGNNLKGGVIDGVINNQFLFLHWNVNGLLNKLSDIDFLSFITSYHFVCLVETFTEHVNLDIFTGFKVFCQPSVKLSVAGRPSGGVICLIKEELLPFIQQISVNCGNFLLFKINKVLFATDKDVLYMCAYIPPEGSRYYTFFDTDGISLLENILIENAILNNDYYIIVSGDLNARTMNISQPIIAECDFALLYKSQSAVVGRCSQDNTLNSFGKNLLNVCTALNLCILNGVCNGDLSGCYTYTSDTGCSVVDYFLMSSELLAIVYDKCMLSVGARIESDHFPVSLSVTFPNDSVLYSPVPKDYALCKVEQFVWDNDFLDVFRHNISIAEAQDMLEKAIFLIDSDINAALRMFNDSIKNVACCMKRVITVGGNSKKGTGWFDAECNIARKNLRKLLRKFRRTLSNEDRQSYCKQRREYKNLLFRKKKIYNKILIDKLIASSNNQYTFWEAVHNIIPKKKYVPNKVKLEDWFNHFQTLLEKDIGNENFVNEDAENGDGVDEIYNVPISNEEVLFALRKLKCKKAAGPDGLIGELFKNAPNFVLPFFVKFFNVLFDKGIYPESWYESIIFPIFKKGDVNKADNYRGISLCNVGSKLYGTIINRRLQDWVTENNITGEHQGGFKRGYSTIDHMFTLLACIQKQFNLNRKLYVAFVDFEKAFDSINRNLLWPILLKNNIKGNLFRCIKSMYTYVKARVRCGAKLTDYINCSAGVKQGDVCSPILFSLFINELAIQVINHGRHGVQFGLDAFELFILLLADDIALLSETIVGLQTQLNNLHESSVRLGIKVNLQKSEIIVFRKGGYLAARERWYLDGNAMSVVNSYKYLGIFFSTRLSFTAACKDLASRGKRGLTCIMQKLYALNNSSLEVFLKLFDKQIQPMILYGSEIWGLDAAAQNCEKVHLYALKKFLGLDPRTPNDFVYGELNRYPLIINSAVNSIRYWLRLLCMDSQRIPKKAYLMLYNLDVRGKSTWVSKVRICLCENGFGFAWYNQGVGDAKRFLSLVKSRLIDCRWQNWHEHINNSERFLFYRGFCDSMHQRPLYIDINISRHMKFIFSKFRFGVSEINLHANRYKQTNENVLLCPLCKSAKEDEVHFVLCCPFYSELRKIYIANKFIRKPNLFSLNILMASTNHESVKKLCIYLYRAFKIREVYA